jgi:hypothetical protein
MYIGPEEGCHSVPDPIEPIDMTFVSRDPTRIPMSLPVMTINGPIFMEPVPFILSIAGIWLMGLAAGLADGIECMSML